MTKNHILTLLCCLSAVCVSAQKVEQNKMQSIYEEVKTPYKYGLVIAPQDNKHKFDCPTIFRERNKWYMTFVCYDGKDGTDGRGYETWLAKSDDLLHWNISGKILDFPSKTPRTDTQEQLWDENQRGGFPALIDYKWGGSYTMQRYKGAHWITYIGGKGTGYEAVKSPMSIGLALTTKDITKAHSWQCFRQPIMSYDDQEAQWWEQLTQYKSTIYKIDKKYLGYPFVMFYNAGGKDETHPKGERIGIALSQDMLHWKRFDGNPVFAHDTDGTITGDAQIVKMGDVFVMFYFSAFNPAKKYNAFNTFATSYDLVHWTDWNGDDLIIPSKPYDEMFAHKSYVIKHDNTVYHFYCAVNNSGQRGIALATSRHLGKSEVNFPEPDPTGHRYIQSLNEDWEIISNDKSITGNALLNSQSKVDVPFNLDDYYGALQQEHGNLHGNVTCKKEFFIKDLGEKEFFIRFEGVGTYADITLNGHFIGHFDIGRTCETVNITKHLKRGAQNTLILQISHPGNITDMPWVCGGCSSEWGFSEGSQPFGIFRPVTLEATNKVRIEPFGVHVWSNAACDSVFVETEIKNYSNQTADISLTTKLSENTGKQIIRLTDEISLQPDETKTILQKASLLSEKNPKIQLWSVENPYLYTVNSIIKRNGKATDNQDTPFGFRTISWPKSSLRTASEDKRFMLNEKPVFINGVCEYEHEFGQSHAFTYEQIEARIKEVQQAGFNAFRDAHQPHNLYYKELLDKKGILWWPQFSAHIWYDTPKFRESFKRHLCQWVKERRNSPSLVLWGLQNESTLPKDFAEECVQIIRDMDPTCGSQRLVTTCNGGEGTDWNVIQNWSGTYGGNIDNYANELKQDNQLLNGEYGAWRTVGNHSDNGYTEEKYLNVLKKKAELAKSAQDSICGHFLWLLNSHDNPGRRQPDEALRRIDKVGPFNHKGLFTIWEQPVDAFYWFKNQSDTTKKTILPYQNDTFSDKNDLKRQKKLTYLYRINCGGDEYKDENGIVWSQDHSMKEYGKSSENGLKYYSHSWGDRFDGISSYQCSQTYNPELPLSPLFQRNRFGRHELYYHFDAPPGNYQVEFYFTEPWYKGTIDDSDYEGWRIFDVAVNDSTVLKDIDIWAQVGYGRIYKRVIQFHNNRNDIKISFPKIKAGQAIISAISIAAFDNHIARIQQKSLSDATENATLWADFDKDTLIKTPDSLLPPKTSKAIEIDGKATDQSTIQWTFNVGVAKTYSLRFKYWNPETARRLHVTVTDVKGVKYVDDNISFLQTQAAKNKRKMTSITTGDFINAGTYTVTVSGTGTEKMIFDKLTIE